MQWLKGKIAHRWLSVVLPSVLVLATASAVIGGSLVYRNYIVRYDRGWDILCEPYVVQKDDWVSKIFRQKGEIAHQDFRGFLGIFKRLNPHIKDVDMIRPGQTIDIPLRKLEQDTLPGQAGGVVTIPFVALSKVTDVVKKHSERYTVQKGDVVSKLISRKYGRFGTQAYNEGIKMLKAANPKLADIDKIYTGQKLYLPEPTIREKSWYGSMYDDQGNLQETVTRGQTPQKPAAAPPARTVPQKATPPKPEKPDNHLAEAAAYVGGRLQAKGTYYLPHTDGKEFELDLSRHPILEFGEGAKLVFTSSTNIMTMDSDTFHSNWPQMKPVIADPQSSTEQYVSAIFKALEDDKRQVPEQVTFENQGVRGVVRAKWIRTQIQGQHLCITPISGPEQQTPEPMRRFLEQNGILLKEILPDGEAVAPNPIDQQRHNIKNILAIAPTSQTDFVKTVAKTLGFTYVPNTRITFPYAGIQVEAFANLLSIKSGNEILVDFGDLYGDAIKAIEETGLQVIRFTSESTYRVILEKIFSALSITYQQHFTLFAVQRPGHYNTSITIDGLLYSDSDNRQTLLTGADLHPAVTDLLSDRGIDVIEW